MSNSRIWSVGSGSGSVSSKTVSIPSLTESLSSGSFENLMIAADNLDKEQASAKIDPSLATKLKKLTEYTRLLVEKCPKTSNDNTNLRVKQKEGGKFWDRVRVESKFYSAMTLCDQLTQTMESLAGHVQNAEKNKLVFENTLRAAFVGHYTLDDRLKSLTSRLVSPETVHRNRMSNNVIDANSPVTFLRQLESAQLSNSMMVILFHLNWVKECKTFLPHFVDIADQYYHYHGDMIRFMRANVKVLRCKERFKVEYFPTIVVIKGDGQEAARVSIEETITVPAFVEGVKMILDVCLGVEDE